MFSGLVWLVNTFLARSWGGLFIYLLNAIIRCVAGYALLIHPEAGSAGVTFVLASLFIVGGAFRTIVASVIQFPRWGWTALAGAASVLLGVILLTSWAASSSYFVGIAIGIDLILEGSALIGFAGAVHGLYKAL